MMNEKTKKHTKGTPLKQLHGKDRFVYIWDYYKLPLILCAIACYIIGSILYGHFTRKDRVLYTAFVNVSAPESLSNKLQSGFLEHENIDTKKNELYLYQNLYLTADPENENYEYSYASRTKIIAAIEGHLMDVVLMDKEAFDAFSEEGYLMDLTALTKDDSELQKLLEPYICENTRIVSDNSVDVQMDDSVEYQAETVSEPLGIEVSKTGLVGDVGYTDHIYLGVIGNSPRLDLVLDYIRYITKE